MSDLVDAVITWVDARDEHFIQEKSYYQNIELGTQGSIEEQGLLGTRFNNIGEIFYCIKLIRKNMPWINIIHLVTNGQKPEFLTKEFAETYGVTLVTHTQLFKGYEQFLPTFNSITIESMLFNIPNLSPNFVYFNDDFFPVSESTKFDFFPDNKFVTRGKLQFKNRWFAKAVKIINPKPHRGLIGKRIDASQYPDKWLALNIAHAPYVFNKDILKKVVQEWGIERIIQFRFRNAQQPSTMGLFINEIARKDLMIILDTPDWQYYIPSTHKNKFSMDLKEDTKFICLQSLDDLPQAEQKRAIEFLENLL